MELAALVGLKKASAIGSGVGTEVGTGDVCEVGPEVGTAAVVLAMG